MEQYRPSWLRSLTDPVAAYVTVGHVGTVRKRMEWNVGHHGYSSSISIARESVTTLNGDGEYAMSFPTLWLQ